MIRRLPEAACLALVGALFAALPSARAADGADVNDYPTNARADYVFTCMAANGQTHDALDRCSCSIDTIASILPYDRYVQAETILRMRNSIGQGAMVFRSTKEFDDTVAELRRAQAEAEILCFK
jgi:hypothetical protein